VRGWRYGIFRILLYSIVANDEKNPFSKLNLLPKSK